MLAGMDNTYRPAGGDPQDPESTEQFWPITSAGPGGTGGGPARPAGLDAHFDRDRHRARRWTIGLTAALAVAVGAVVLGLSLAGGPSTAAGGRPATLTGAQGAALDTVLNSAATGPASSPSASPGTVSPACAASRAAARADRAAGRTAAARAARQGCQGWRRYLVHAALLRGIDGQITVRAPSGLRTLAFERGTVQSLSGSAVTVRATDGTTWTWDLVSSTVVREKGSQQQRSVLAQGQAVWVGGQVTSGARDARLIVIDPPGGVAGVAPRPAPSSSASGS
jgi:hypothetical protein